MTDEQILDYLLSFGLVSLDIDWDALEGDDPNGG